MILRVAHFLIHILGIDYGVAYGKWVWYNFWSGVGGSFLVGVAVFGPQWYIRHSCHDTWRCLRWGKYEAAGGMFKYCHRHHPDFGGKRPDRETRHRLHREWKAGQQQ